MKILIVDDACFIRAKLKQALEKENFHVIEASNGTSALKIMLEEKPEIVSLDIGLPDGSGLDFLEKMIFINKKCNHNPKYLVVSGQCTVENVKKGIMLGAKHILAKPLDMNNYMRILNSMKCETIAV